MPQQSFHIGVISPALGNYYYGEFLQAIRQVLQAHACRMTVLHGRLFRHQRSPASLAAIDGWLLLHPIHEDIPYIQEIIESHVPVISVSYAPEGIACSEVVSDDYGGTRALVEHLIEHGHRRIACVSQGRQRWSVERVRGYSDALLHAGITPDPQLVIDCLPLWAQSPLTPGEINLRRSGQLVAKAIINRTLDATAYVAGPDLTAISALQELRAAGIRVPQDVALVGFDDLVEAQHSQPPLTTIRTEFGEFARTAALRLIGILRGEFAPTPETIRVPAKMIRRDSCGCPSISELINWQPQQNPDRQQWRQELIEQLTRIAIYPLLFGDLSTNARKATDIWPGVEALLDALDAAVFDLPDAPSKATEVAEAACTEAWKQAVGLTKNLLQLDSLLLTLEQSYAGIIQHAPPDRRERAQQLFRRFRYDLMQVRVGSEMARNQQLKQINEDNQAVSRAILATRTGEGQSLEWLRRTPSTWGCLALWDQPVGQSKRMLRLVSGYQRDGQQRLPIGRSYTPERFPPDDILPASVHAGQELVVICDVQTDSSQIGILALVGYANYPFIYDTDTLPVHMSLLAATLQRDMLIVDLEAQTESLARARDAAEAANQAKTIFLANMSHELRTPLNGILGYAQVLARTETSAMQIEGLRIIQQSGQHLLNQINDLLDLAKIEAGKMDLEPIPIVLNTFIKEIIEICRIRAEQKGLRFVYAPQGSLPMTIHADERRLREVILNLLGNAIKFTQQGEVRLQIKASEVQDALLYIPKAAYRPTRITIQVIDTGCGIAPQDLETIFRPFEQVRGRPQQREGTGLGLAISQSLLQKMDSQLHVQSELNAGSTFWFELVMPASASAATEQPANRPVILGYEGLRKTILVVDDHASNRQVLITFLQALGFQLIEAHDGLMAVERFQEHQPDLILMDLSMPQLDGIGATSIIRKQPNGQHVPIIATSASVFDIDRQQSLLAGCDAFLPKPIQLDQLTELLEDHLQITWLTEQQRLSNDDDQQMMQIPTSEELHHLYDLAMIGDMLALQDRTNQLSAQHPELRMFARHVGELANQFEVEQILTFLTEQLNVS
ncbi:MAG: hypothetical protein Fur005_45460 [Roseiflexaceae bacterium]